MSPLVIWLLGKVVRSIRCTQLKNLLLNGEVVAIPTETVYGLGAIGLNPTAVKKDF